MKRKIYLLILFYILCFNFYTVSASEVTKEADTNTSPKILFIGNSFTYKNNMPNMFAQLSYKAGFSPKVTSVTKGEWSLEKFANPTDIYGQGVYHLLTTEKWDYVILQDQSKIPVIAPMTSTYPAVSTLQTLIKKAGAKTILFMTWGYDNHSTFYIDGLYYHLSANQMQTYLTKNYFYIGNRLGIPVSPVGIGFSRCNDLFPEIDLYHSNDLYHPSVSGSYLSACTLFSTIYNISPLGNSYLGGLNEATVEKLQQIADRKISLNKAKLSINRAQTTTLAGKITVSKKNTSLKNLTDDTIHWTSLDDSIVSVDYNTGKITGMHTGTTMVKAYTKSGLIGMCNVTVKQPATSISLPKYPIIISRGKSIFLDYTLLPLDSTDTVSWNSSAPFVATVSKRGKLLTLSPGMTKITATTTNGKSTSCKIYVKLKTPKITRVTKVSKLKSKKRVNVVTKWNKVDGIARYHIYRSKKLNSGYSLIAKTKKTKFIDKNKFKNKTYYYKIVAIHSVSKCSSNPSNAKSI